ncbi:MAG: ACP S-malonyltransferase [Lachnospiraceae bacterium]|nr:ACP S-malonyltransferase [Lachnospiraceae bacterium]
MKTAFLFSGQGAQYPGMMHDIYFDFPEAKYIFDIAENQLDRNIGDLCFKGKQEELNLTHNTQPCVLAADLAAYMALCSHGIKADAVAGFSLGEYAALVAAGVINIQDSFSLIQKRADYMQEAVPIGCGAMAAIMKQSADEVERLCNEVEGYVVPANYNCPGQIVISGEIGAVDKVCELSKERKIRAIKLAVSAPFHCKMMEKAADNLRKNLIETNFSNPDIPIYLNVNGEKEMDGSIIREQMVLQVKSPVMWEDTLRNMVQDGIDTFVELGPGNVLSGFVKKTFQGDVRIFNITDVGSLKNTIDYLK